jgi:hypothetical protein
MWARYRKSLVGMQSLITLITLGALILSHRLLVAGAFFITMQLGALFGAMWATRLERLFLARSGRAAPERRG